MEGCTGLSPVVAARDTKWKAKKNASPERRRQQSGRPIMDGDQEAFVSAFLMPAWDGSTAFVVTF